MSVALRLGQAEQKESGPIASGKPVLPMPEGLMKRGYVHFTVADKALIAGRWGGLTARGMTNTAVGASLADEMGKDATKITGCIKRMLKDGTLVGNRNIRTWKRFSDAEKEGLAEAAGEMAALGKNDTQIAGALARRMGRSMDSIHACMRRMVMAGKLVKNPKSRCTRYLPREDVRIMRWRAKLAAEGASDKRIGEALARKMKRSAEGIESRIQRMVSAGKLETNPNNKAGKLSETDKRLIRKRRAELIPKGRNDHQIAHVLARRTGKKQPCIRAYLVHMVEKGELQENPNKREMRRFSAAVRKRIGERREKLIDKGQNDSRIAHVIGRRIRRDWKCVLQYINGMVEKGALKENPNKRINTRWDVTRV